MIFPNTDSVGDALRTSIATNRPNVVPLNQSPSAAECVSLPEGFAAVRHLQDKPRGCCVRYSNRAGVRNGNRQAGESLVCVRGARPAGNLRKGTR